MTVTRLGYLVPIKIDLDGTPMLLCCVDTMPGAGSYRIDAIGLWCPTCQAVIEILPDTAGIDLDVEEAGDALLRREPAHAETHRLAVAELYDRLGSDIPA